MHIIVGNISAHYTGRGDTKLVPYDRVVIYKDDGTVSIHGDKGYKPLNYMAGSSKLDMIINENREKQWNFSNKKENLLITFHKIYDEINLFLGDDDPGYSSRTGTEKILQEWLSKNINELSSDFTFIQREFETGAGKVDILAQSGSTLIPIEVKKTAPMTTVSQINRYVDALKEKEGTDNVIGVIAAVSFSKKTEELAKKYNISCLTIPEDWEEK